MPALSLQTAVCTLPVQTPREQRERLACEARMQQLPDGIEPQPGPQR